MLKIVFYDILNKILILYLVFKLIKKFQFLKYLYGYFKLENWILNEI